MVQGSVMKSVSAALAQFAAAIAILGVSQSAPAATNAVFTCEKIKDKATRESCIQDRSEKKTAEAAEKETIVAAEKEKAFADEKNKERDEFVRKSKEALTQYYKDPSGAQFTNLIVYQRGYEANSKVIQAADQLSQTTINLIR